MALHILKKAQNAVFRGWAVARLCAFFCEYTKKFSILRPLFLERNNFSAILIMRDYLKLVYRDKWCVE